MHYHELRFLSSSALSRAFGDLLSCPEIEGCLVDTSALTLRFSAPTDRASQLLGCLHQRGELASWTFQRAAVAG